MEKGTVTIDCYGPPPSDVFWGVLRVTTDFKRIRELKMVRIST